METPSLTETETPKERVVYVTNLEGMILKGIINHRIGWRICNVLVFSNFAQDFDGAKIMCPPDEFPSVARRIAAAKVEYLKGNRQPLQEILEESIEERINP